VAFAPGHLADHPLPPGITGALGVQGYQLLSDVGGVGAARLGEQAFLLVAPDPDPAVAEGLTQLTLHQPRLRAGSDPVTFVSLSAQLGYLRLSGYRLVAQRAGLRSRVQVIDPATGAVALVVPERHPGRLFGGGASAERLLAAARALPPAGPPPDVHSPRLLHETLLALALGDESLGGAQAAEVADRALALMTDQPGLDATAALSAAKRQLGAAPPRSLPGPAPPEPPGY
jgi:hypothetical protein